MSKIISEGEIKFKELLTFGAVLAFIIGAILFYKNDDKKSPPSQKKNAFQRTAQQRLLAAAALHHVRHERPGRAREADQGIRLGDVDIAQKRVARGDTGGRWVGQD